MNYLKYERNFVKKKWTGRTSVALVFPNAYEVGMANLGYLFLYQRLNDFPEIVCERVFLPEKETIPTSVESGRRLNEFDIVLFSIPFELDYPNVLKILKLSRIPLFSKDRELPVLAGGVALWLNPFPLEPFVDAFVLAEWEEVEDPLINAFLEYPNSKNKLLSQLNEFNFTYVPLLDPFKKIKVAKKKKLSFPAFSTLTSSLASFKDTYLVEVSRGCGKACRFCAAGYVYRPPRGLPKESLIQASELIPPNSKVGLIGLEFADKEEVLAFGEKLLEKNCRLSFSSIRIDSLSEGFLELLKGLKSVAIAPETGSERLKKVINKPLTEEEVTDAIKAFSEAGIKNIKLYFILGLPTETKEDLILTGEFVRRLLRKKFKVSLSFSFSFFVPKPHTPFQWHKVPNLKVLEEKKRLIYSLLKGVKGVKVEDPKSALLQTILIRGGKDTSELVLRLSEGARLKKLLRLFKSQVKPAFEPEEIKDFPFPWNSINVWVKADYLWNEWQKAKNEKLTNFCTPGICRACGACN